jgi:hypothetical protein
MSTIGSSSPFLVRSTESGAYFQRPLAGALRGIAVLSFAVPLALLFLSTKANDHLARPFALMGVSTLVAAVLAAQILFARARRIGAQPGAVRFPVTPALRESARGVAEAYYVWAMVLSTTGLVAFVWSLDFENDTGDRLAKQIGTGLGAAALLALLGWLGLLVSHLVTELATVMVEVANNTSRGFGASSDGSTSSASSASSAGSAGAADWETLAPVAAPAPAPILRRRIAGLVAVGVLLAGVTYAVTATNDVPSVPAPSGAPTLSSAASTMINTANRIRAAEAAYDANHDGYLPVPPGAWSGVSSVLALTYGPELEDCTVTATGTSFEVRCTADKDGDGCALTVTATNDVGARTLPGTEGCT